ncbi:hypothetical protein L9Z73_27595, partial [Pseudomonas sp. TNT11]
VDGRASGFARHGEVPFIVIVFNSASVCRMQFASAYEDLNVGGAVRRFDLLPMAVDQPTIK